MSDYQQAQKAEKPKQKEGRSAGKSQKKTAPALSCPNCLAPIPEGALFCPECGFDIGQPLFCPNCGAKTSPGADICQSCGTWLLEGKCKFCYAEIPDGAEFCPECGNPKDGIVCPGCGKLNIFDFCSSCGSPLTENALKTLELAKDDPETKALLDAVGQAASVSSQLAAAEMPPETETSPTALAEASATALDEIEDASDADIEPAPPARKSLFSERQIAAIMKTGENRDAAVQRQIDEKRQAEEKARIAGEEERKRQERLRQAKIKQERERREAAEKDERERREAAEKRLEKQREQAIAALNALARQQAAKRFSSHQEARRWYMSHRFPDAKGWLCNYSGTVHLYPDGPNGCDQPALGGCDYFEEPVWGMNKLQGENWVPKT
jgi:ribosomal protein L40E